MTTREDALYKKAIADAEYDYVTNDAIHCQLVNQAIRRLIQAGWVPQTKGAHN